jgi:methyl-accepting chemotaxis protein
MNTSSNYFVAIATIAAELRVVMEVAEEISLAAANAKAIAFRAGDKAKGFQPITDFINELAKNTITLVNEINNQTLLLYQLTIEQHFLTFTIKQFDLVHKQSSSAKFNDSMGSPSEKVHHKLQICRHAIDDRLSRLELQLIEIMHPARAARVIAANSRIEASQAEEYQTSLYAVAESVEHAASIIHTKVQHCRNMLITLEFNEAL